MRKKYSFLVMGSIIMISTISSMEFSFAKSEPVRGLLPSDYGLFVFVQTYVQNPNGELVTYLASDKFTFLDVESLNTLLDNERLPTDRILTINEQKFEIITREYSVIYQSENVIASTMLGHSQNGESMILARFAHDGYPVMPGDIVNTIWTFIRPID